MCKQCLQLLTHLPVLQGFYWPSESPEERRRIFAHYPAERERERNWTWEINRDWNTSAHFRVEMLIELHHQCSKKCWFSVLTKYIFSVHFHHHQRPSPICSETPTSHREFKDSLRGFWEIPPVCKCVERHTPDCESEALKVYHTISWDAETYGRPSLHDSYSQRET